MDPFSLVRRVVEADKLPIDEDEHVSGRLNVDPGSIFGALSVELTAVFDPLWLPWPAFC